MPKKTRLLRSAFQNWPDQAGSVRRVSKVCEPDEVGCRRSVAGIEAEADGIDERVDRENGVDRKRRARGTTTTWIGKRERTRTAPPDVRRGRNVMLSDMQGTSESRMPDERPPDVVYFLCGPYQLARPSSAFLAASSGFIVPFSTWALTFQSSFSRFGVPRDRIW